MEYFLIILAVVQTYRAWFYHRQAKQNYKAWQTARELNNNLRRENDNLFDS